MNVGAGGPPRRADLGDLLAPLDELALSNQKPTRMRVDRAIRTGMLDDDDLAVTAHSAAVDDATGFGREDRGALLRRDIDPVVGASAASAEMGTQSAPDRPGKAQRTLLTGGSACAGPGIRGSSRRRPTRIGRPGDASAPPIGSRNQQALADAKGMRIPDSVGSSDPACVDAIVQTDPIEILAGSDVMNHAGLAARAARRQEWRHEKYAQDRAHEAAQDASAMNAPVSVSDLPGPSIQSFVGRCLGDIERLAGSGRRQTRPRGQWAQSAIQCDRSDRNVFE